MEVDELEETQHVGGLVRSVGVIKHLARRHIHGGKEVRGAVTLIVVGHCPAATGLHRQRRLGAIKRLDLGLFVEREDDGSFGRIHVEPDHVDELGFEVRVGRDLERVDLLGFQVVVLPDARHGVFTNTVTLGHQPGAPMRRSVIRGAKQGVVDHSFDRAFGKPRRAAPSPGRSLPRRLPTRPRSAGATHGPSHSSCCTAAPLRCWPVRWRPAAEPTPARPFGAEAMSNEPSARELCVAWPSWPAEERSPMAWCHFIYPSYINDGPLVRRVSELERVLSAS